VRFETQLKYAIGRNLSHA